MKRFFACLMAVTLGLCLLPAPFAAADEAPSYSNQIVNAGSTIDNAEWVQREGGLGAIRVSKAITPVVGENENYFDITLTAQAKQIKKDQSISVVIVMDVSNTMNRIDEGVSDKSRVANAKAAANQFIEQFCKHQGLDADRKIGVVAFNTHARWEIPLKDGNANESSDVDALQKKINNIAVSPALEDDKDHVRFTNIEGGLQLAYEQLKNDDAANKFVIMLTDGFPTTYVKSYNAQNNTITGYDPYTPNAKESKEGHFYDEIANMPVKYGTDYSDRAALKAQTMAQTMKNARINIFSVGISIGQQTIKGYVDYIHDDVTTVDRETSQNYVIGSASEPNAYRQWLGNSIGGGPNLSGAGHVSYSDGDNASELKSAYASFLNEIALTQASPLTTFYTEDPMGNNIEFLHFYKQNGEPAATLKGASGEGKENTASFNASTKTISWNKLTSGFTRTSGTETIDGKTVDVDIYTYTLKYRVRLTNEASGFAFNTSNGTNDNAKLKFASEVLPEIEEISYPDPSVQGYKGSFSFTKMTDNATPDNHDDDSGLKGAEFVLAHSNNCSICAAEKAKGSISTNVTIPAIITTSGDNGAVNFDNIPSGHEYILSESATLPDHELNPYTSKVTIAYGETAIQTISQDGNTVLLSEKDSSGALVSHNKRLEPATIELEGAKHLLIDGKIASSIPDNSYKFRLAPTGYVSASNDDINPEMAVASIPMPTTIPEDAQINTDGSLDVFNKGFDIYFGKITYTAPGTYTYAITELPPASNTNRDYAYVGHDARTCMVTVEVTTISQEGTSDALQATASYARIDGSGNIDSILEPIFENTIQPVTATLKAQKIMTDSNGNKIPFPAELAGVFSFQLRDKDGIVIDEATNDADGNVQFKGLQYTQPGTYKYEYSISEVATEDDSFIYDDTTYKATVVVTADGDSANPKYDTGTLIAAITYTDKNDGTLNSSFPVFTNKLRTPAELPLKAYKTLDGEAAGGFQFKLTGTEARDYSGATVENATPPMPTGATDNTHTATSANDGTIDFGTLKFYREGTYFYTLEEVPGNDTSIIYSTIVHNLAVVVEADEETNALKATLYDDGHMHDDTHSDPITFANATRHPGYAKIDVAKTLINGTELVGGEFQFKLTPVSGPESVSSIPMPEGAQPEADGSLIVSNDENGQATFGHIKYTKEGTYNYHVSEIKGDASGVVYDETIYDVIVKVQPPAGNEQGTYGQGAFEVSESIVACSHDSNGHAGSFESSSEFHPAISEGTVEFVNVDTTAHVPLVAYKTLDGKPAKANAFAFQLLNEEGNLIQEVRNTDGGMVQFNDLTFTEPGTHRYTIAEVDEGKLGITYDPAVFTVEVDVKEGELELDGKTYSVLEASYTVEGKNFTEDRVPWFKNTTPFEEINKNSAKTGDPISPFAVGAIAILAAAIAGVALFKLRRA